MKVEVIYYITLSFALFVFGCSKNKSKSDEFFKKKYTIKIVEPSSKEGIQKELNELYENNKAIYYGIKISLIEIEQKKSDFEYDLKKVVIESQAIGVDWKEKCKLIQNKQKEEIIADQLMIKIQQDMLEDNKQKYKELYAKYNLLFGDKKTNEVDQVYLE
jgi:hypothetical protein